MRGPSAGNGSTMDLIDFFRQRLAEDERVAQRAGSRATAWPASGTWHLEGVEHDVVGEEEAFCHPHNAEHIARHDPARVLREVEADKKLITAYERLRSDGLHYALQIRAERFDKHADYREEWRPHD